MSKPRSLLAVVALVGLTACAESAAKREKSCSDVVPSNPYSDGSGHYAGYVWAEENEPGVCSGNSSSFIEGCETYLAQADAYEECIEGRR